MENACVCGAPPHISCLQISRARVFGVDSPQDLGFGIHRPVLGIPPKHIIWCKLGKSAPSFKHFTATCWTPVVIIYKPTFTASVTAPPGVVQCNWSNEEFTALQMLCLVQCHRQNYLSPHHT